jgi:hypothetical protein
MPQRKIATCCYCGTRAALVLTGTTRHELACSSCGAPLHDLKMLRSDHVQDRTRVKPSPLHDWQGAGATARRPKKPPKRRKSFGRRFFEEAVDLIEDIFD